MAVIGKIREKSTLVLIIIGGAIIAFVLGDLFSSGAGAQQGPISIAEVNGNTISPQEFDFRVQKAYEQFQVQSPDTELDEETKSSLRETVWNEMLTEILLGRKLDETGISVTSKELFDMVQGEDPHPNVLQAFSNPTTGQFEPSVVVQFLQNLESNPEQKESWIDFEKALKKGQKYDKYFNLIKKGTYTPAVLAKKQYTDNNTQLSFRYVYKPYTDIVDSTVTLSEDEIGDFYNENIADYDQESSIGIAYAYFPVEPSVADREEAKEWIDETHERFKNTKNDSIFVNANSDERFDPLFYSRRYALANVDTALWSKDSGYITEPKLVGDVYYLRKVSAKKMAPDSIGARHILISTREKDPVTAEKIADSLLALIKSGTSLIDLVVENSDDVATAQDSGNIGWFTESTIVPIFRKALTKEIGEVSLVQSPSGFHIMEVTERTEPREKIRIASIKREILPGKETYADIFNEANSFSIEVNDLESFNNLIVENNIQRRGSSLGENDNLVSGLVASRDLARWAKEANEGSVSEAYDVEDAFVVAIVESVNRKGAAPLDKVRNRVEYLARQGKKAELLKAEMAGATDLGALAGDQGLSVENATDISFGSPAIPGVGLEPEVVAKAMSLQQGQVSKPIAGENGVFVISIENKNVVGQENIAQIRSSNNRSIAAAIDNGILIEAIKKGADLKDNRAKFY